LDYKGICDAFKHTEKYFNLPLFIHFTLVLHDDASLTSRPMKLNRLLFLLIVLTGTGHPGLYSQVPQPFNDLLVTTDWLEENRTDSLLVILHYGLKTEFDKEHIPGARYISIWDILVEDEQGLRQEFPGEQILEQVFRSWGLNNNSKIIICYQDWDAIRWAARLFVTLDYAGLGNQVAMLNGGLKAWKDEGRAVTQSVADFKEGNVDIQTRDEVRISKEEVVAMLHQEGVVIVDARSTERYYGTSADDDPVRAGHIEGAVNIPNADLTLDDSPNMFKTRSDLRKLFGEQGISPESLVITYCGTGILASTDYFVARLLGYRVRFYDGSFQEWSRDESLPLSKSATRPGSD
jgi:thiosulfate/3-mercaptopyruvate sulfurtransferase